MAFFCYGNMQCLLHTKVFLWYVWCIGIVIVGIGIPSSRYMAPPYACYHYRDC